MINHKIVLSLLVIIAYNHRGQINTLRRKIKPICIALWNANDLAQHKYELEFFLKQQEIS